ncbi:MAG: hypothetical protein HY000_07015 [Planctomycetes bacterium]|nr:hypothetical protein [Planctomycetota bacterium]
MAGNAIGFETYEQLAILCICLAAGCAMPWLRRRDGQFLFELRLSTRAGPILALVTGAFLFLVALITAIRWLAPP